MIIEKEEIEEVSVGIDKSVESGIEESSLPFIFDLVTTKLYSNKEGSLIREIASNCQDANTEAGVDTPIIINIQRDHENSQFYIEFCDQGFGMDSDRIDKIYMKWFSSTKRTNNNQIGGFGIGSKTPLAYADYFYITSVKDGFKNHCLYQKTNTLPKLDYLVENEPTDEPNGTKIRVDIANDEDYKKFSAELLPQLAYFDNVYVNHYDGWLFNEYEIFEGNTFKYRTGLTRYSAPTLAKLHLVIDVVAYPIVWELVEETHWIVDKIIKDLPLAIKFNVGELDVTPSREQVQYNTKTINAIRERVDEFMDELREKAQANCQPTDDFAEYLRRRYEKPAMMVGTKMFVLPPDYADTVRFTGLPSYINIPRNPFFDYNVHVIKKSKEEKETTSLGLRMSERGFGHFLYSESGKLDVWNNRYHEDAFVITRRKRLNRRFYYEVLGIGDSYQLYHRRRGGIWKEGDWKKVKEYRDFIHHYITSQTKPYHVADTEFIKDWKDEHKTVRQKKVNVEYFDGDTGYRQETTLQKLSEYLYVFVLEVERASGTSQQMRDSKRMMDDWNGKNRIKFIVVNKSNYEKIKELTNLRSLSKIPQILEFQNYFAKLTFARELDSNSADIDYSYELYSKYYEKIRVQLKTFRTKYLNHNYPSSWSVTNRICVWKERLLYQELQYFQRHIKVLGYIRPDSPLSFRKQIIKQFIHITKTKLKEDDSYERKVKIAWANANADRERQRTQENDQGQSGTGHGTSETGEVRGESNTE